MKTSENRVRLIIAASACLVFSGCALVKRGNDDIGDGYLSEGGWDPFRDAPRKTVSEEEGETDLLVSADGELSQDNEDPDPASVTRSSSGSVQRLEDLFKKGDYRQALAQAKSLRSKSEAGSTDRDVASFIAGASQYYLGQFQAAQADLDAHVEQFENSRHRESALYYQASNRVRLQELRVGAALLDSFIASHPDSLLLEFALFDRATCHFGLGETKQCLEVVGRMESKFIYSKIRDRALALKGDAQREIGELAGAQASYKRALDAAVELKHRDLEARCLAHLTAVAAMRSQNQEAVGYYREFFDDHAGSRYATKAAVGGLPALEATGKLDAGLQNLERILQAMPQSTDASVMNEALVEYAKFYREKHGPEKLLRQLGNLSSAPEGSSRFKEQLVIARLEALETYFPDRIAEIRVFYKEMRARFKPGDLSSANVLKLADYIAEQDPSEAVAWYENALARGITRHKPRATLGLAKAHAKTGDHVDAERGFRKVLETFGSPEYAEEATLGIARIARDKKDWNAAAHYWQSYLDHQSWNLAREEARKGLEESKSHGAVAKAPVSKRTVPVKAVADDPVAKALAQAERLAAAGDKDGAYNSLDQMLKRFGSTPGLSKDSKATYRKAQIMHEDLSMELGR